MPTTTRHCAAGRLDNMTTIHFETDAVTDAIISLNGEATR
jgi:hypothetical protein